MALTHTHRVVVEDLNGDEMVSNHLDSEGSDFGHDEHVGFLKNRKDNRLWEHTHEKVEERYDPVLDSIAIHPEKTKAEKAAAEKVAAAQADLEKAQQDAGRTRVDGHSADTDDSDPNSSPDAGPSGSSAPMTSTVAGTPVTPNRVSGG